MQSRTYYMPVRSETLAHYFSRAILLPSAYFHNKPPDIQNRGAYCLVLSRTKWTTETDCSLEVVLTDLEEYLLSPVDDERLLLLFSAALPISRVSAVYFHDISQSRTTQFNINSGDGYLPTRLIRIQDKSEEVRPPAQFPDRRVLPEDFADRVRQFDVIMGSVSFLNIARRHGWPYAKDYFSIVSYFNTLIRGQFQEAVDRKLVSFDDRLTELYKKDNAWRSIQPYLLRDVSVEDVEAFAREQNVKLKKNYGVIDLRGVSANWNLYLLSLLATFGPNKRKGISDLISEIIEKEPNEKKAEEIAFIFGLHLRYSGLRNAEKAKPTVRIKFALESKLEYYVIESIYHFVFTSKKSAALDYIDPIVPPAPDSSGVDQLGYPILDVFVSLEKSQPARHPAAEALRQRPTDRSVQVGDTVRRMTAWLTENVAKIAEQDIQNLIAIIDDQHETELRLLRKENAELREALSNKQAPPVVSTPQEQEPVKTGDGVVTDDLNDKDMKKLKALAGKAGMAKGQVDAIKSTPRDLDTLMTFIRKWRVEKGDKII